MLRSFFNNLSGAFLATILPDRAWLWDHSNRIRAGCRSHPRSPGQAVAFGPASDAFAGHDLIVFASPSIPLFPLKLAAVALMHEYWHAARCSQPFSQNLLGGGWVTAFVFDVTRDKLLGGCHWVERLYELVSEARVKAARSSIRSAAIKGQRPRQRRGWSSRTLRLIQAFVARACTSG